MNGMKGIDILALLDLRLKPEFFTMIEPSCCRIPFRCEILIPFDAQTSDFLSYFVNDRCFLICSFLLSLYYKLERGMRRLRLRNFI